MFKFHLLLLACLVATAHATRFIRFKTPDGDELAGDAILPDGSTDVNDATSARVIEGNILTNFTITDTIANISSLLAPLHPDQVRSVRCVGFNYVSHNNETSRPNPEFPILFYKPFSALAGPGVNIPVTPGYQNQTNFTSTMDYEAELVVVIKDKVFNVSEDDALNHVLGYAVGNDVSHRGWQIDRGGEPEPQYSMGKDADGWAPWGPAIVTTDLIPDPQTLMLTAVKNGELKQNATTADMIFNVKQIVSFFSMGITLMPGDVIFTGTPAGTQFGATNPVWLTDGDNVTVALSEIGSITNTYRHVSIPPATAVGFNGSDPGAFTP